MSSLGHCFDPNDICIICYKYKSVAGSKCKLANRSICSNKKPLGHCFDPNDICIICRKYKSVAGSKCN